MIDNDRTYQIARKTTCKATKNQRSIIQSYKNYIIDPIRSFIEHVQDIYERCAVAVDTGLKITHIEIVENLVYSLEHPNMIEFSLYYQTSLDRWSESLQPQSKPEHGFEDKVEDGAKLKTKLQYESNPEEVPKSEHDDNSRLELEDNLKLPEPQVEIEI